MPAHHHLSQTSGGSGGGRGRSMHRRGRYARGTLRSRAALSSEPQPLLSTAADKLRATQRATVAAALCATCVAVCCCRVAATTALQCHLPPDWVMCCRLVPLSGAVTHSPQGAPRCTAYYTHPASYLCWPSLQRPLSRDSRKYLLVYDGRGSFSTARLQQHWKVAGFWVER